MFSCFRQFNLLGTFSFFSGSTEWFDTTTGIESEGDEDFYSTQDGKKFLKKNK